MSFQELGFILQALTLNVQLHHPLPWPSLVLGLASQVVQVVFGGNVGEVKDQLQRRVSALLQLPPAHTDKVFNYKYIAWRYVTMMK